MITIQKGESFDTFISNNFKTSTNLDIVFLKIFYQLNNKIFDKFIHYGDFYIKENLSYYNLLKIITNPSNVLKKITIVEGWSKNQLELELLKYFDNIYDIPYEDIIADTYYINNICSYRYIININ